jgi:hypothetical protein
MSTMSSVPFQSLTALSRAVDAQLPHRGITTRSSVFSLCIEAVAFGLEVDGPLSATRAGSAAHLLLELTQPDLDPTVADALAEACRRATGGTR